MGRPCTRPCNGGNTMTVALIMPMQHWGKLYSVISQEQEAITLMNRPQNTSYWAMKMWHACLKTRLISFSCMLLQVISVQKSTTYFGLGHVSHLNITWCYQIQNYTPMLSTNVWCTYPLHEFSFSSWNKLYLPLDDKCYLTTSYMWIWN